jgi:hypothetical protein
MTLCLLPHKFPLFCVLFQSAPLNGMHWNNVTNKAFQKQKYSLLKDYALHNSQGVTRDVVYLSWLTNSALVYEPKFGGGGVVAGFQPMSTALYRSPNKLWRSNSICNYVIG